MIKLISTVIVLAFSSSVFSQNNKVLHEDIRKDLYGIISNIQKHYIYLNKKNTDLNCISDYYSRQVKNIKSEEETVLFFEYLLNEFYDNHLTLHTNRKSSYRLYAPIYAKKKNGRFTIANAWQSQIDKPTEEIIGAEIISFNGVDFKQAIDEFPTYCNDKNDSETREWIANKILAGRYNEPRILTLRLPDQQKAFEFDLDSISFKKEANLLTTKKIGEIGILRINNSLGNDLLVTEFDKALDSLSKSEGLIIDLRNTVNGGDTYEARGIMGRFIDEPKPYQKHSFFAQSDLGPDVKRSWVEYVSPRLEQYKKPIVVLVGRWTGSMGEGLAIGLENVANALIVGTEMRRLAGEVDDFYFNHQPYGYKLSTAKLFHVNGTEREKYVPEYYVKQTTLKKDEILDKGVEMIDELYNNVNTKLRIELEKLGTQDQTLRLLLPEAETRFGRNSEEYKFIWSLIDEQDSIAITRLEQIIDTYGWLGKSKVGAKANQAIWLIIQHADIETQEAYLPILKQSVENRESEGWHLAFLVDRILMKTNKKQKYGTQAIWDSVLGKNKIYPINEIESVNDRRKKLGLQTIEEYAKSNGYILNKD